MKLWDLKTGVLDQMLALNLRSGYNLARAVVPGMLKAGRGSIVNARQRQRSITERAPPLMQRPKPPPWR